VELDADLPAAVEAALYHVAQEALNNSLKHAAASSVSVSLRGRERKVELEIVDNGIGFSPGAGPDLGGLGLLSIRERAQELDGQVAITSQPGEGMRVWISIPIDRQN
jgi:signal transduction histidine kinase